MTVAVLAKKKIVLGVTGSVACYKAVDLASKLTQAGALVDVIVTDAAQKFVTPLVFSSVTGRQAYDDMWREDTHVQHVNLGETADLLVIVPATAHTLAKLANGLADNLLTVTALAARCPLLVAPAMDGGMFTHPAVQANLTTLVERGATVIGPAEGRMASGLVGQGRLVETPELLGAIRQVLGRTGTLAGKRVVITAGPTQEAVDPVRFLTNHSSGKQGIALAQAALDRGADVVLITGPIHEPLPLGATVRPVRSAAEMCDAVLEEVASADFLLMAAAVADFRPATRAEQKIKKQSGADAINNLSLTRTPDILQTVKAWRAKSKKQMIVLGFAAETENVTANGRDKLKRKGLDFIVINDVSKAGAGFKSDTNEVLILGKDESENAVPMQSKQAVAEAVWDVLLASS